LPTEPAKHQELRQVNKLLDSLGILIIAMLRDSQNFAHAAEGGLGICEMQPYKVKKDMVEIDKIIDWIDGREERRFRTAKTNIIEPVPNVVAHTEPGLNGN
jgi:hypothetical protein